MLNKIDNEKILNKGLKEITRNKFMDNQAEKKSLYIYMDTNNLTNNNILFNNMNIPLPTSNEISNLRVARFNQRLNRFNSGDINSLTFKANNDNEIIQIINSFRNSPFKVLATINDLSYTLNNTNINRLNNNFNQLIANEDVFNSDGELIQKMRNDGTIKFTRFLGGDDNNAVLQGGFFKYYHDLDFDLKDFGLFNENDDLKEKTQDNCLIQSFKSAGLPEEKITEAKLFIKNRNVQTNKLSKICEKLKIYITIRNVLDNKNLRKFGNKNHFHVELGLIEEHYFHIKDTDLTSYAIKNYDKIANIENWNHICKKRSANSYNFDKSRTINSYKVVKCLIDNKDIRLKEIELCDDIYKTQYHDLFNIEDVKSLEYNEHINIKSNEYIERKDTDKDGNELTFTNLYFDFETTTDGIYHKSYLCCVCDDKGKKASFHGENSGKDLLYYCAYNYGDNIRLIAHNVNYDFRFIYKYLYGISELAPNNRLMTAEATYYFKGRKINIQIKDSYSLISKPLGKFKDMFNINVKKEILPYILYSEANVKKRYIDEKECLEAVKYQYECNNIGVDYESNEYKIKLGNFKREYIKNCNDWNCFKDNKIDIIEYSKKYCEMDCEVLMKGYELFREWILKSTELDVNHYPSLASISNDYLVKEGCYDDVMKMSGIPRAFIQKCVVGGRTMLKENKPQIIKGKKIADFDGVSLYPSSMVLMEGFLKGSPKVIENFEPEKYDGYFIEVIIEKVNKKLQFPLLNKLDENGVRLFNNDMEGEHIFIDKTTLEDLIEFHEIEYKFIRGYYYNEGFNTKIQKVIKGLFNTRLEYKKQGNPIQEIYKLLMNSGYGKAGLKPVNEKTEYVLEKNYEKTISRQYNFIKEIVKINDKLYKFIYYNTLEEHYNNVHIAVSILSYSKRIMCKVMCLAEDLNLNMYYTDTDSIHIDYDDVVILAKAYKKKYNTELIGKNIGQFHIDFDDKLDGIKCDNVHSDYLIALGKKIYIDRLVGNCKKTGKIMNDYHIRLKGVSENSIKYTAKENYNTDLMELYEDLSKNIEGVEFDLLCGGMKCSFEMNKDLTINSRDKFSRVVKVC